MPRYIAIFFRLPVIYLEVERQYLYLAFVVRLQSFITGKLKKIGIYRRGHYCAEFSFDQRSKGKLFLHDFYFLLHIRRADGSCES